MKAPGSAGYSGTAKHRAREQLHTVCEEAGCPNIGECWEKRHATMMIMGDTCTRACAFCNVKTGLPGALDEAEPEHVGAAPWPRWASRMWSSPRSTATTCRTGLAISPPPSARSAPPHRRRPSRCLTPDFLEKGDGPLEVVIAAKPDVFNHNLETVPALYLTIRPGARYFHSLRLLQRAKELDRTMFTKSGIMVGLGEKRERGAPAHGRPAHRGRGFPHHRPVPPADARSTPPWTALSSPPSSRAIRRSPYAKGFLVVASSPLTRSSYHAARISSG